jgi:hypothetical protein
MLCQRPFGESGVNAFRRAATVGETLELSAVDCEETEHVVAALVSFSLTSCAQRPRQLYVALASDD